MPPPHAKAALAETPAARPSELPASEAAAPQLPAASASAQVLAFRTGRWRFVVDVHRIVGVLGSQAALGAPVGRTDLDYIGWQGEAVPVLGLAALLGDAGPSAGSPPGPLQRVLLLRTARGLAGLRIEEAEQVLHLRPDACLQAEQAEAQPSPWCLGFCRHRGELYGFFDVRALAARLP